MWRRAVSRVKTSGGLMFESAFNLSMFKEPKRKGWQEIELEDVRMELVAVRRLG
jgi:hypothetical protein